MSSLEATTSLNVNPGSDAAQSRNTFSADFDNFLLILTTQLQNQDPLSPTDTSEFTNQLVLFADVEQSIQQNDNLEQLIALQSTNQAVGALSYIGQEVEAEGDIFNLPPGGTATLNYNLPAEAQNASISIFDSSGAPVFVAPVEGAFGQNSFVWDGTNASGSQLAPGVYTFTVNAVNSDEQPIEVSQSTRTIVDGVESDEDGTFLTSGILSIPLDNVFAVRQPGTLTAPDQQDDESNNTSSVLDEIVEAVDAL